MSFTTHDSYGNVVELPGDTGPSTKHEGELLGLVRDGQLVSDGTVLCKGTNSTSRIAAEALGLVPVGGN